MKHFTTLRYQGPELSMSKRLLVSTIETISTEVKIVSKLKIRYCSLIKFKGVEPFT